MQTKKLHQLFLKSSGISTDTRNIAPNTMFFALRGENFNANEFAGDALEAGASYAIIDETPAKNNPRFLLVTDVLQSLQQLAAFHRRFLGTPIIALTGSNGKTTTKELLYACLSTKFRTLATAGNLNNHIGVPLSLLRLSKETEIGIIEMGANHPKEIAFLCEIAQPDYGYITNFGKAHLEGFKSIEGVIAAKSELYEHLKTNKKHLFLNSDDPVQRQHLDYSPNFNFGNSKVANLHLETLQANPFAGIVVDGEEIKSHLIGGYNSRNIAAAFAISRYFEVPVEQLKTAINAYNPTNNRSQILELENKQVILDAYNANPTSMAAAVENLQNLPAPRKIAILGDMFELGSYSDSEHQHLVEKLQETSLDEIYLIGKHFHKTISEPRIRKFEEFKDFKEAFNPKEFEKASILIKGSRGMALERVVELLKKQES